MSLAQLSGKCFGFQIQFGLVFALIWNIGLDRKTNSILGQELDLKMTLGPWHNLRVYKYCF